jgi:hypothetical protein
MISKIKKPVTHRVFAIYQDRAEIFPLAADTSLADLAERLAPLSARPGEAPVHVEIVLAR